MTHQQRRAFLAGAGGAAVASLFAGSHIASASQQDMGRSRIILLSTYVAGMAYEGQPGDVQTGDTLKVVRNAGCAYDPQTVEIWTKEGVHIGHVPRSEGQALARLLDAGFTAAASVDHVRATAAGRDVRISVYIDRA